MEPQKPMETIKKDERITNVLIVDSNLSMINEFKDWIKKSETESKYSLSFKYARNAMECMKKLNEMEINLVVLEIALPMISGYYLINAIQKEKKDLPIIIYTKLKNPQDLAKMASTNVNNIFLKELMDIQDLVQIIRKRETGSDIDQVVMELNSQIKALHGTTSKQKLELIQCPTCHLILAPDSHFCNNCGQKILRKPKALSEEDETIRNQKTESENPGENPETNEEAPALEAEAMTESEEPTPETAENKEPITNEVIPQ